jgi:peptidoglycan hydrolase CwlO-like protein
MNTEITVALIVLTGGVLTILGNLFVSRWNAKIEERKYGGTVSSSDAASLWEESNNLRKEYKERAASLEKQLETVNAKLQTVMQELSTLRASSKTLNDKIESLKKVIKELQAENTRLLKLKGNEK